MRRDLTLAVSLLGLAAAVAAPALAQSPSPLSAGRAVEGRIEAGDAAGPDNAWRYDAYAIEARAGQRFEAVMRSDAFDAYLEVFGPNDGDTALASDDDGLGEGTHARLRFAVVEDGTYVLRARPLAGLEDGAYTLALTQLPRARPAPRPGRVRIGQTLGGRLAANDAEADDGGAYDAFTLRLAAGERIAIDLTSEDFDPVVRIGRTADGAFDELAMNDDGADTGLNSRLLFTAPEAGDYVIRATALDGSSEGAYSLGVAEGPEPPPSQPIELGATVAGELTAEDGKAGDGGPADAWRFSGTEGQRVRIEMSSSDFDTYLELFDENRVSLAQDDDGAPTGTDSWLTFTLPGTGDYIIEARAFSDGMGAYSLTLKEVEPEQPPAALAFGATLEGEIGEADARDAEDRGYDAYLISGRAGQRIQAIMRSGDFDTFLQIARAGEDFAVLASDDDGLREGTDSRLNYALPEDGDYVLRALPLASDGKGLYSLELIDRGPQPRPGSLLVGATARGALTENDATADDNSFFDAYRVTLKEGDKLLITMVSNDVDSLVAIGRPGEEGAFEVLGTDDDSLSDTHAKLEWTAPSDGSYEIRAGTFQQGQTGTYALNVEKQP